MGPLTHAIGLLFALQTTQATIAGTVRDAETGEPIAGAVVALTDVGRSAATDAWGRYALIHVPPGPQHLAVRRIGHAPHTLHALVPPAGRLQIDVLLRPAPVRLATIAVRPEPEEGEASATIYPDRAVAGSALRQHPLLAEPDALQALGGGEVVLRPESPSGVHVRGGASDQTGYAIDDVPVLSPYHAGGLFGAWNPDAVGDIRLSAAAPALALPDALSGTVEARTIAPGEALRVRGGVTTAHARVTMDGPLARGAGYVLSARTGYPGLLAPRGEGSYLRGRTSDWLAKAELPALGGRLSLLGYGSENDLGSSAVAEGEGVTAGPRNEFRWSSLSLGASWRRDFGSASFRTMAWSAGGEAEAGWAARAGPTEVASERRDLGLLADLAIHDGSGTSQVGTRLEWLDTELEIAAGGTPRWRPRGRTLLATGFAGHDRAITPTLEVAAGASLTAAEGRLRAGPRVRATWDAARSLSLTAAYARTHQYVQSLRNPESVVGTVFPADLPLAVGAGIPAARSDQAVLAADYRPAPGVRLGMQAWTRGFGGLVLAAPLAGEPFATTGFAVGSGSARGASLLASVRGARYGVLASYGWQRVRYRYAEGSYVPEHGAEHLVEAGAVVHPWAATSVRLSVTGALGRRATGAVGGLEWEACNLLDRGCEFRGSPYSEGEPLGGLGLPAYWRVDLGVRHHWHLRLAGRSMLLAVHGTFTNLLDRHNVLTRIRDPKTGGTTAVTMRPRAPLVLGLDWAF